ncbi:pseudouridine synthase, partial [Escherichia coli]
AKHIRVLYEDEHLIIVDKPAGMKTHPNEPTENSTLLNHLAAYLDTKKQRPYVVHRLDKETSGAVLFAKNPFVLPIL